MIEGNEKNRELDIEIDLGGATKGNMYPLKSTYIFEGNSGSTHTTWEHVGGMIEMFTYLNLPILFGITL